jgi:predicted DNA-binding transcriptional regulator AlpA
MIEFSLADGAPVAAAPSEPKAAPVARGYLRQREACRYLGVSKCFLISLERKGLGPRRSRIGPRAVFYAVHDLDAWVSANEVRGGSSR